MDPHRPDSPIPSVRGWMAALLLRQPDRFMPRLAAALACWRSTPRGIRRRLQRRAAAGALGVALLAGMVSGPLPAVHAATITVDETTCTLINAIKSANTNTAVGGCATGAPGLDTIDLATDVLLTAAAGNYDGDTGLPAITSEIIIEGNGFTIERDSAAPDFRILYVGSTGDLTLNDVTISGGESGGFDWGGGFLLRRGTLAVNNSTISDNIGGDGGGGANDGGTLTVTDSVFRGNYADGDNGGGLLQTQSTDISNPVANTTITSSLFENNEASNNGGGIIVRVGELTVVDTTITGGKAEAGPGIALQGDGATVTVIGSTITNNGYTNLGGGVLVYSGVIDLVNTTISGNSALGGGGGIANYGGQVSLINATVTDNYTRNYGGGGIFQTDSADAELTISRSIVSGNIDRDSEGSEIKIEDGSVTADDHNVFSHAGVTSASAFTNFTPGASDFDAGSDAGNIALAAIIDTTLADNGGSTHTHNLVDDSPAVDLAPDADCAADPTGGVDQRGFARPRDVFMQGNDAPSANTCDAGAVEFVPEGQVFMSATTAGTTDDGVVFGPEDILGWDNGDWGLFFDGSAAGLTPTGQWKHNINAFHIDNGTIVMSFTQNARFVPGIAPKIDGMDLVKWDGSAFSLFFDGSDVGLTNKTQEKIDALHILPGSESPIGGGCIAYLLVSTQGPGRVTNGPDPGFKFGGEDVLGFCATNLGADTAGVWHLLLDGSAEGMPRNSTDSISVSDDGQTLYLTTRGTFNVDSAAGGHSMVYEYDFGTGTFNGPVFNAPSEGLPEKVDGLQMN